MDNSYLSLPWFTNHAVLLGIFLGALLVFHIALVKVRPLTSIGWKWVDYIWLSMAIFGLLGATTTMRTTVAKNYLSNLGYSRIQGAFNFAVLSAQLGMNKAFCGEETPAPIISLKPPSDGFEEQCAWFRTVVARLQKQDPSSRQPINIDDLVGNYPTGGDGWTYKNLLSSVAGYNDALEKVAALEEGQKLSGLEELMQVLGPHLLAIALALRMTKVTGEIALERTKSRSES